MLWIRDRLEGERGSVIVLVALVLPLLFVLTAGGIAGFGLYASHRELQRVADQAALAGAAVLPPLDPNMLIENPPFPLPDTDAVYEVVETIETATGHEVPVVEPPRMRDLIPDPRAVACTVGETALKPASSVVVNAFKKTTEDATNEDQDSDGSDPLDANGLVGGEDEDTDPADETVCEDDRVYPVIETNPDAMTPVDCTNELILHVAGEAGLLDPDADPLLTPIQDAINSIVQMPLNRTLPAAFAPRMRVQVRAGIEPPLLSFITGRDSGTMRATAVAYRRIKNAVVVPILPAQQLEIELGLVDPIEVVTDPVNLNRGLETPQSDLLDAIDDADQRLNDLMAEHGLPCHDVLHNLRRDLRDIYDPPTGPAPSATDVVDAAILAAERTAERTGIPEPDPDNPDSLAGEAFLLVGIAVDEFMQPVSSLQIPILDMALVTMRKVSDGSVQCSEATLVDDILDPILDTVDDTLEEGGELVDDTLESGEELVDDTLESGGDLLGIASLTTFQTVEAPETCYDAAVISAANAHGAFRATLVE